MFDPQAHLLPGMFDPQSHLHPGTFSPPAHLTPSTFGLHCICPLMLDRLLYELRLKYIPEKIIIILWGILKVACIFQYQSFYRLMVSNGILYTGDYSFTKIKIFFTIGNFVYLCSIGVNFWKSKSYYSEFLSYCSTFYSNFCHFIAF